MRQILHYLIDHPEAKDTSTGIRDWWATQAQTTVTMADLNTVLDVLVGSGWLDKREGVSQHPLYGFDEERLREQVAALKALKALRWAVKPHDTVDHSGNEREGRPGLISEQEETWHFKG